jgi:hypothetical protein
VSLPAIELSVLLAAVGHQIAFDDLLAASSRIGKTARTR